MLFPAWDFNILNQSCYLTSYLIYTYGYITRVDHICNVRTYIQYTILSKNNLLVTVVDSEASSFSDVDDLSALHEAGRCALRGPEAGGLSTVCSNRHAYGRLTRFSDIWAHSMRMHQHLHLHTNIAMLASSVHFNLACLQLIWPVASFYWMLFLIFFVKIIVLSSVNRGLDSWQF